MKKTILNNKKIHAIDRENMLGLLVTFPQQCRRAVSIARDIRLPRRYIKKYRNVVFLGLGGSAIGADIIKSYVSEKCILPIHIIRHYSLPAFVNKDSLVIATSYSGNTEETMSMYKDARARRCNIICVTSGGQLRQFAYKDGNVIVMVPGGFPPRLALGFSFIPSLLILGKLGIIGDDIRAVRQCIRDLDSLLKNSLEPEVKENIALDIARRIHGKFPVIYTSVGHMDAVGTRWRGQLNENAKTLASSNVFPELNHNEIVGWQIPIKILKKFVIVLLRDKGDHSRIKIRMDITSSILRKEGVDIIEVISSGRTLLSRIMSLIYIGDFTSFYLSIMNRIDPTPVERIAYLKSQLVRRS